MRLPLAESAAVKARILEPLFFFSFPFPFSVVRAVIFSQAVVRHMHMFAFNFQMGRQASNNSAAFCFMDLDDWLTCLLQIARKFCTMPWDANMLMAEPGCLNFQQETIYLSRLHEGSAVLYLRETGLLLSLGSYELLYFWHDGSL